MPDGSVRIAAPGANAGIDTGIATIVLGALLTLLGPAGGFAADRVVTSDASLREAIGKLRPGDRLLLAPGRYAGGITIQGLTGSAKQPIVIAAQDPANPPVIAGGGSGMHLADAAFVELRDLVFTGATGNGLNLDDGGTFATPSHHVTLWNLVVTDVGPQGNRDGIKLSGLDDFLVTGCRVERWGSGGSAIDMVGCHKGRIDRCLFRQGGASAVQMKGGSSEVAVTACRFENAGERAINIGGSTGMQYFRPRPEGFEARDIRVEGCTFSGGDAPIAFVGVDGAVVRHNTFYRPRRWAIRILRETNDPGFVRTRRGTFEENVVVFQAANWFEGGVNLGPPAGIEPESFRFRRNAWFCEDRPARSAPRLPVAEEGGLVGIDPQLRSPMSGDFRLRQGSPASGRGSEGYREAGR
jgi:hypothetical protein